MSFTYGAKVSFRAGCASLLVSLSDNNHTDGLYLVSVSGWGV